MGKTSNTTTTTTYGNTTTSNPYVTSKTDNSGTISKFNEGTALNSIYDYVNKNIYSLLDEYLNPNINSQTNQAKLNSFAKNFGNLAVSTLENNIINPLSKRNMIRSSQASDLYKNLSDKASDTISSYINELIAESQNNTASVINNLLKSYLLGYDVIADTQKQSLKTSQGNATTTANSGSGSSQGSGNLDLSSVNNIFGSGNSSSFSDSSSSNMWANLASKLAQLYLAK